MRRAIFTALLLTVGCTTVTPPRGGAVAATEAALTRIAANDRRGARINAVLATMPDALAAARRIDAGPPLPLAGLPVLVKDNIETRDAVATTAGSLALKDNITRRDAPLVARLRTAGAVILGKTNLSEWANIRSENSTSGWSAVGGLTRNPHGENRNACGSSSGSGAAVAAGFVSAAVGTETDGSITCPASVNGIVGLKPTVGLVSRTFVVPISASQDTAGPMTADVMTAARLLTAMAGSDALDPATREADAHRADYAAVLARDTAGLKGLRVGVVRDWQSDDPALRARFDEAVARLAANGATLVEIPKLGVDRKAIGEREFAVLLYELKRDMAAYLGGLPAGSPVTARSLADLIAFNKAHADTEMRWFGQDLFELAQSDSLLCAKPARTPCNAAREYARVAAEAGRLAGPEGIDRVLRTHRVDLLVQPTNAVAWQSTLGKGDAFAAPSAAQLPAVAGYPHLTVPMGKGANGLPVGLSFIGPKWSESLLLRAGYAFERGGPDLGVKPRL